MTIHNNVEVPAATTKTRRKFMDFGKFLGGAVGAAGAAKKATDTTTATKSAAVEERKSIVRFLGQQSTDVSVRRKADDVMARYLSEFERDPECYACMQEVRQSLSEKNEDAAAAQAPSPSMDCACVNCSCGS